MIRSSVCGPALAPCEDPAELIGDGRSRWMQDGNHRAAPGPLGTPAEEDSQDHGQNHSSYERDQDGLQVEPGYSCVNVEKHRAQPTAQQAPGHTDDDVTEDSKAAAFDNQSGQPTCDQSNYDPSQYAHGLLLY